MLSKELSISDINTKFNTNELKPSVLVQTMLSIIKERDPEVQAFLSVFEQQALEQAHQLDQKQSRGEQFGLLEGIPVSIKDAILIQGYGTTSASKILENYTAVYDATVISKLKKAGVIFLGKTNMDEFAMGSSTESSAFQKTTNPEDPSRVPGGSSGGAAASVGAHMALAALGSDTGGSIRQPAALTGVVGLKPTYGRVSRFGLIAMASSLDQIGPLTHNVLDSAYMLEAIEGQDPYDATSVDLKPSQRMNLEDIKNTDIAGLKIGLPDEYFIEGIAPEVKKALEETIEKLTSLGAIFKPVSLPYTSYAISTYYVLMPAEVSTNLARFDGIRYGLSAFETSSNLKQVYTDSRSQGFGDEVKRRIMLGTYVLSSGYYDDYYTKAKQVQGLIKKDFETAFEEVDLLLTPTTPNTAFKMGEKTMDPLSMYLEDIFTVAVNLAGIPAISIPTSLFSSQSQAQSQPLPIGFQLIGKHFDEQTILKVGYAFETSFL